MCSTPEREVGPSLAIRGWLGAWVWPRFGVWFRGWLLGRFARLVRRGRRPQRVEVEAEARAHAVEDPLGAYTLASEGDSGDVAVPAAEADERGEVDLQR
jgi:hypothetical protein